MTGASIADPSAGRIRFALYMRGACLFRLGRKEEAEESLRQGAQTAKNPGDRLECLQYLADILAASGKYEKPYRIAAKIFFFVGQYEDAVSVFERARENGVAFGPELRLYEIKTRRKRKPSKEEHGKLLKDCQALAEELEKEAEPDGQNPDFRDSRPEAQRDSGRRGVWGRPGFPLPRDWDGKMRRLKSSPRFWNWMMPTGMPMNMRRIITGRSTRIRTGRATLKIFYMTRQLALDKSCYYYVERGRIYMQASRFAEAIEDFREAIALRPDDWAAYNNAGCCCLEEAEEMLKKAVACVGEGKNVLPYGNLADCYEIRGNYAMAAECCRRALEWQPDILSSYRSAARLLAWQGDCAGAVSFCRKAKKKLGDTYRQYWFDLGKIRFFCGNTLSALGCVIRGIAGRRKRPETWADAGEFFMEYMGRTGRPSACLCGERSAGPGKLPGRRWPSFGRRAWDARRITWAIRHLAPGGRAFSGGFTS